MGHRGEAKAGILREKGVESSGVHECIGILHCVQDDGKNKQRRKQFQAST
jgi:hypothetical protein